MKNISKKILCLMLTVIMLSAAALPVFANTDPASRTQLEAPKAITAPTIDGTKDESIYGTSYSFANDYGSVAYAWDEHYIYAYVAVTGDTTPDENYGWDTDRLSLFFDVAGDGNINSSNRDDKSPYLHMGLSRYIIDHPVDTWGNDGNGGNGYTHGWLYSDYTQKSMIRSGGDCAWPNVYYVNDTYFAMAGVDIGSEGAYAYEVKIPNRTWIASEINVSEKAGTAVEYRLGHTMFVDILVKDQQVGDTIAFNEAGSIEGDVSTYSSWLGAELKLVKAKTACADHTGINTTIADNGDGTHSDVCPVCYHAVSADSEPHSGGTATCQSQKVCEDCGAKYDNKLEHQYTAQRQTEEHLATPADGDNPATYYYCCTMCGENDTSRTFEEFEPTRLELEATKATPTIDGTKDAGYGETYYINQGGSTSGEVSFAWDENYIYAYMVIKDATDENGDQRSFWTADRVRWYLDLANKQTTNSALNGGSAFYIIDMSRKAKNTYGPCEQTYNNCTDNTQTRYIIDDKSSRDGSGMTSGNNVAWVNGYINYFNYHNVENVANGYIVEMAVPNRSYIASENGYREPNGTEVEFKEGHVIGTDIEIFDYNGGSSNFYYVNTISEDSRETSPAALSANLTLVKANTPCTTHSSDVKYTDNGDGTHAAKCPTCLHEVNSQPEGHSGGTADCTHGKTCEKCGAHYGDTVPHDFTGKKTTRAFLAAEATYDSPRLYYYSCTMCDLKGTETFEVGTPLARPDDGTSNKPSTSPEASTSPETEAPETEAPETEAPETEAPETEAPETKGCKSMGISSLFVLGTTLGIGAGMLRIKKKNKDE